jgi:integrase
MDYGCVVQKRRANGSGTIWFDKDRNRYIAKRWISGKRVKRSGHTQAEVLKKLDDYEQEMASTPARNYTVSSWLEEWLRDSQFAASTRSSYASMIRTHINPVIGSTALHELSPTAVRGMLARMRREGKSPNTQRLVQATLRSALATAEDDELVTRNVARSRRLVPKIEPKTARTLAAAQAKQLIDYATPGDPISGLVLLMLTTALRRGEVLGLRWRDVDLATRTIAVEQTVTVAAGKVVIGAPKTKRSRRTVDLPAAAVEYLSALERLDDGLVFRSQRDNPLDPNGVSRRVKRWTESVLGEPWSPHEMRHSCASLLVSSGVPLQAVSDLLGHTSIDLTARVYAKLSPQARSQTATAFDALLEAHTTG